MSKSYPDTIPAEYVADAYRRGWNHGHGVACCNVPRIGDKVDSFVDWCGLGKRVTADNIREYHELLCHAAADSSRDFSPFEFTAHEFNSAETDPETGEHIPELEGTTEWLWESFEAGTRDAIAADLLEYSDDDYGIEKEESADVD